MKYLIWSYEHEAWWGPEECGYVTHLVMAGLYEMKRAEEICRRANRYLPDKEINEAMIPEAAIFSEYGHQTLGVGLMREAIDLPFMPSRADWDAWCKGWAERAEAWIRDASL